MNSEFGERVFVPLLRVANKPGVGTESMNASCLWRVIVAPALSQTVRVKSGPDHVEPHHPEVIWASPVRPRKPTSSRAFLAERCGEPRRGRRGYVESGGGWLKHSALCHIPGHWRRWRRAHTSLISSAIAEICGISEVRIGCSIA